MAWQWHVGAIAPLACALFLVPTPAGSQAAQAPAQPGMAPRDGIASPHTGTAVLRGQVVAADSGRPLRRARVTVVGEGLGQDARRTTSTNLDGRYELKDLPAARYRVSVARGGYLPLDYGQRRPGEQGRPVQLADGQTIDRIDFYLPRMGIITGRITDENGEPIEGVSVSATRSLFFEGQRRLVPVGMPTQTDDAGEFRLARLSPGTYFVMASTKETWTVTADGKETMFGYLPTYYPGAGMPAAARSVRVAVGQEVAGIDVSLVPGRAATVSGTATDSRGRPFSRVSLSEEVRGLNFASFRAGPGGPVAADGSFSLPNVPPGSYTAQASRQAGDSGGEPEVALIPIVVDGADIENLMLVGSSGGTVSGRVVSESGELPGSGVRVRVTEALRNQPSPAVLGTFRGSQGPGDVKQDGEFTATNVFGRARFQVTVPEGWMLKSVMHGGRDITDAEIELRSGEALTGVEVLVTSRVTSIGGQVVDGSGAPLGDATVLVFTSAADKWFESSRAVRAARPDQQGQWQIKGLPPGEYLTLALEYIEDGAWNDPEYLESLRSLARKVALADGGSETLSLEVAVTQP